jgi:hypothetical protein
VFSPVGKEKKSSVTAALRRSGSRGNDAPVSWGLVHNGVHLLAIGSAVVSECV